LKASGGTSAFLPLEGIPLPALTIHFLAVIATRLELRPLEL